MAVLRQKKCVVVEDIEWLRKKHPQWRNLKSIIEIEFSRNIQDKVSIEKRYYINSLSANAKQIANAVQQHWGIENKLHWVLDVCFSDDQSRIRK